MTISGFLGPRSRFDWYFGTPCIPKSTESCGSLRSSARCFFCNRRWRKIRAIIAPHIGMLNVMLVSEDELTVLRGQLTLHQGQWRGSAGFASRPGLCIAGCRRPFCKYLTRGCCSLPAWGSAQQEHAWPGACPLQHLPLIAPYQSSSSLKCMWQRMAAWWCGEPAARTCRRRRRLL